MYLRSGQRYQSGQRDLSSGASIKSSEESVANSYHALEPIAEEDTLSDTTSSMSLDARVSETPEYSMAFNMRLSFEKTNAYGAHIYKDPLTRWVVKVEDHPTALETAPWVNYQGDQYIGQNGERFVIAKNPDMVDKWGQEVKETEVEKPPFDESDNLKFINAFDVRHVPVDNASIAMYIRDTEDGLGCYFAKNPASHTILANKVLYVFLEGMLSTFPNAFFVDKFGIKYEPMERRMSQDMTWQGLPIPEIAPKASSSMSGDRASHLRRESKETPSAVNPRPGMSETKSGKSHIGHEPRVASAPPLHATYDSRRVEPSVLEVPSRLTTHMKPAVKTSEHKGEVSGIVPAKGSYDSRRVRPANFQKWVKKYSGAGDPYDHLASFKQVARAEQVTDLHTKVEGFGLTLEGRALSWFQTLTPSEYESYEELE